MLFGYNFPGLSWCHIFFAGNRSVPHRKPMGTCHTSSPALLRWLVLGKVSPLSLFGPLQEQSSVLWLVTHIRPATQYDYLPWCLGLLVVVIVVVSFLFLYSLLILPFCTAQNSFLFALCVESKLKVNSFCWGIHGSVFSIWLVWVCVLAGVWLCVCVCVCVNFEVCVVCLLGKKKKSLCLVIRLTLFFFYLALNLLLPFGKETKQEILVEQMTQGALATTTTTKKYPPKYLPPPFFFSPPCNQK